MKKSFIVVVLALVIVQISNAQCFTKKIRYSASFGYNIGGTAPIDLPESIRELNSYKLQSNFVFGLAAYAPVCNNFAIGLGLKLENKDMSIDAVVKNYQTSINQGTEALTGRYYGNVYTLVRERMVTMHLTFAYSPNANLAFKLGPYVSYLLDKGFSGYAHKGYLRVGDSTGPKIDIGEDPTTRGNYNYSNYMCNFQFGINFGAEWYVTKHWGIYGEINWGLTGIHKKYFNIIKETLYPIFGSFGIMYRFGK